MCTPPTPPSLGGTRWARGGMTPAMSVPVVSVRYLPATPLAFASPFGNSDDFEFRRRRADSHALAASTTTRARACRSLPSVLSTYATPVTRPLFSSVTSRAIAFVTSVSFPVARAGAIRTLVDVKFELLRQPRLHWLQ